MTIFFQRSFITTVIVCCFMFSSVSTYANPIGTHESGKYLIHYSVFNSLFVPSKIAQAHQLPRAKNKALLNISVHLKADNSSVPATVTGNAKNLIQQQTSLAFKEIKEQNYQYYLAELRHTNEEVMHFHLTITPAGATAPITLTFSQKLYTENP